MPDTQHLAGTLVTIVTLPFLLFIGILVIVLLRLVRKAGRSKRWPIAEGRIIHSEVVSRSSRDANGTQTTIYEPSIRYAYTINGQRYESKTIRFDGIAGASTPALAESVVAQYPLGGSVQVFYNSTKPTEAVLEHSGGGTNGVLLLILSALELGLLVVLVLGLTGHFA